MSILIDDESSKVVMIMEYNCNVLYYIKCLKFLERKIPKYLNLNFVHYITPRQAERLSLTIVNLSLIIVHLHNINIMRIILYTKNR